MNTRMQACHACTSGLILHHIKEGKNTESAEKEAHMRAGLFIQLVHMFCDAEKHKRCKFNKRVICYSMYPELVSVLKHVLHAYTQ